MLVTHFMTMYEVKTKEHTISDATVRLKDAWADHDEYSVFCKMHGHKHTIGMNAIAQMKI